MVRELKKAVKQVMEESVAKKVKNHPELISFIYWSLLINKLNGWILKINKCEMYKGWSKINKLTKINKKYFKTLHNKGIESLPQTLVFYSYIFSTQCRKP